MNNQRIIQSHRIRISKSPKNDTPFRIDLKFRKFKHMKSNCFSATLLFHAEQNGFLPHYNCRQCRHRCPLKLILNVAYNSLPQPSMPPPLFQTEWKIIIKIIVGAIERQKTKKNQK